MKRFQGEWSSLGFGEGEGCELGLAVVRDLREQRPPLAARDLEALEVDVLSGFVLARASAGLADTTVRWDLGHLEAVRMWFGRPLWEMEPQDADAYFGRELRNTAIATRLARAQTISTYFEFLELRHQAELYTATGRVVQCPIDEMNRPRGRKKAKLRIPPQPAEVEQLFAGWAQELATCRKFAPTARNYASARLMADVGLRINEVCRLDLADVKWELGVFGKLHVRWGKGSRGSGRKERMAPLINDADRLLRWYVEDIWGLSGDDHTRPGAPLFLSERRGRSGWCGRVGDDALRRGLAAATRDHLPTWAGLLTPHVLRHFCASQLYMSGVDLVSIQEMLGHQWITTTMGYIHVHRTRIEEAWIAGQQRAAGRLRGLAR